MDNDKIITQSPGASELGDNILLAILGVMAISILFKYFWASIIFILYAYEFYVGTRYHLHKMIFSKEKIIFIPKKNKNIEFKWDELKTIRYEEHKNGPSRIRRLIYFSTNTKKKPSKDPTSPKSIKYDSFFVFLEEGRINEKSICAYPMYLFLDKLKEWNIEIDIADKYIERTPELKKYASKYKHEYQYHEDTKVQPTEDLTVVQKREWIIESDINKHVIKINEDEIYYHVIVDNQCIRTITKRNMAFKDCEIDITLDNDNYMIVSNGLYFGVVHEGRYIHNNRKYMPFKRILFHILICFVLSILLLVNEEYNLFLKYTNLINVILVVIILPLSIKCYIEIGTFAQ